MPKPALAKDRRVYISGSNYDFLQQYQDQHGYRDLADTVNTIIGHYRVTGEMGTSMAIAPLAPTLSPAIHHHQPQPEMQMLDRETLLENIDTENLTAMEGW